MSKEIKLYIKVDSKDGIASIKKLNREIKKLETARSDTKQTKNVKKQTKALQKQVGVIKRMKQSLFSLRSYWLAVTAAIAVASAAFFVFKKGFTAVESFKLSVASLAATITTFADGTGKSLAGIYKEAYTYSEALVYKMEEWNAKTVATGANLSAMVETMAQAGVNLDLNNKEQEKGFLAIATALALITQGQNQAIQFRQETRGILLGELRATNLLARLIDKRMGGGLKKNIELWTKQGTLVENMGKLLTGFVIASADLSKTWLAVGTTLETIGTRVLRGMFLPVYEDIIRITMGINESILNQDDATKNITRSLKTGLYKTWISIKNVCKIIWNSIAGFKGPLLLIGKLSMMVLDGWGQIFAIMVPISKRVKLLKQAIWESIKAVGFLGKAIYCLVSLNFEDAANAWEDTKEAWKESGKLTAKTFASGFGAEIKKEIDIYNLLFTDAFPTKTPEAPGKKGDTVDKDARKAYLTELNKLDREAQTEKINLLYDGFVKQKELLKKQRDFNIADAKTTITDIENRNDIIKAIQAVFGIKMAQISKEETKQKSIEIDKQKEDRKAAEKLYLTWLEKRRDLEKQIADQMIIVNGNVIEQYNLGIERAKEELRSWGEIWVEIGQQSADVVAGAMTENLWSVIEGTKSAKEAFIDYGQTVVKWLFDIIVKETLKKILLGESGQASIIAGNKAITALITELGSVNSLISAYTLLNVVKAGGAIMGGFVPGAAAGATAGPAHVGVGGTTAFGMAQGGAFEAGKMLKYAKGGIVNQPTLFPMKNGAGLMGEAGPEAVMPLTRMSNGNLGVKSEGNNGGQTINIMINAVDSQSFAEAIERNPGSIVAVVSDALEENTNLRHSIRNSI